MSRDSKWISERNVDRQWSLGYLFAELHASRAMTIIWEKYRVADPDALATPAMLLFQDLVEHNIRSVCELAGGG